MQWLRKIIERFTGPPLAETLALMAAPEPRESAERTSGRKRSSKWPATRAAHLRANPACAVCGCRTDLEVHHILPFHVAPDLELNPRNLLTLGERCPTGNHHLLFGHLGDWSCWNEVAEHDVVEWRGKINTRRRTSVAGA